MNTSIDQGDEFSSHEVTVIRDRLREKRWELDTQIAIANKARNFADHSILGWLFRYDKILGLIFSLSLIGITLLFLLDIQVVTDWLLLRATPSP